MSNTRTKEAGVAQKQARTAYNASKLRAAQRNIHILAGIASVVNFLFLVCDLSYITGQKERIAVAIARYGFSILLVLMIRVLQRSGNFASFATIVTLLEAASILIYLVVFWLYDSPHFMIQSMGLIALILVIFIVPNRSGNMLILSISAAIAFFALSFFCVQERSMNEMLASAAYAALTIVLCSVTVFGNDRASYQDFVTKARLEQASSTDFLTNAATRARLEEEARRWMSFCRRQGLPLCLVFVDVDNLKRINDDFGHAMGDIVLKSLAELMQRQLRNSDTIARWGGDEFVLLLPNVSLKNAVLLLDRVKHAIEQIDFQNGCVVSCSYGVVEMGAESTYQQMLGDADKLMYRSKKNGKGNISYQDTAESGEAAENF
ncbi:MAG: GGDEF domain-containing protein [Clostridiales bacterium]|nr:GGDEF domain-containing protein [Clostridiales bacterium]